MRNSNLRDQFAPVNMGLKSHRVLGNQCLIVSPLALVHRIKGEIVAAAKRIRGKRKTLFNRSVWKVIAERERELNSGRGVEIRTVEELRKTIRRNKSKS